MMMAALERSPERDAALRAMLPHVAEHGWTVRAIRAGLASAGEDTAAAAFLFQGALDMVEAYLDLTDRRMVEAAAIALAPARLSERVRSLIALRLQQAEPEREALRRATALLALPMNAPAAGRAMARTVDAIWRAAGDQAADFSWYTKRGTLAAVYGATLLNWLRRDTVAGSGDAQSLAFLDRRLGDVARLGKLQARLGARLGALLPARLREHRPTRATAPAPDMPPVFG
jgi:ubiquinone biosynthesis protein COQ9